ncbi:hypothetical protein RQP46_008885 [Phenoliferia psychrophenolica]
MYFYELFLICHVAGAVVILVALCYHVPSLAYWLYPSAGIWAYERLIRILQAFPSHFSPVVQAEATLVDGAIILHVPTRKRWTSGQHSYITICDPCFPLSANLQPHPVSIANLAPTDGSEDTVNDMRFIIKVRNGMTSKIARTLRNAPGHTRSIWVVAEGPYGSRVRTEEFQELLLVAGGSGISHCMSAIPFPATTRAPSPVETLFHELSQRTDITLSPGRPPLDKIVRDFVTGAGGRSLVTSTSEIR